MTKPWFESFAACVLAIFFGCNVADAATAPPELYLAKPSDACVERFDVSPKMNLADRKERFLRFMDSAFAETNSWKISFTVAGIDYQKYLRFYVVHYQGCDEPGNLVESLQRNFGDALTLVREPNPSVISSMEVLSKFRNPVEVLRHSVPDAKIGDCLITLEAPTPNKSLEAYLMTQAVWKKYRIPLVDVGWTNSRIFLIVLRGCVERDAVLKLIFELSERSGLPLKSVVSKEDLHPDVNEYLSTLTH